MTKIDVLFFTFNVFHLILTYQLKTLIRLREQCHDCELLIYYRFYFPEKLVEYQGTTIIYSFEIRIIIFYRIITDLPSIYMYDTPRVIIELICYHTSQALRS